MGRPYSSELTRFDETYQWSLHHDVGSMVKAILALTKTPVLAVGSGGSYSAAQFCADIHQLSAGAVGRAVTPLELVSLGGPPLGTGVVIYTARGKNDDILAAWRAALEAEPPTLVVVTATPSSPIAREATEAGFPTVVDFALPSGRDGFLATNSLLAFCLLTLRAYAEAFGGEEHIPTSLTSLVPSGSPRLEALGQADTVSVLHGYTTHAAAVDFESKCTEAALARVQIADYRNFAHGRHYWLAKHPDTTVLALVSPEDRRVADETLRLLPHQISVVRYESHARGMLGGLAAVIASMRVVEGLAALRGVDPGKPTVPAFGRNLYSLHAIEHLSGGSPPLKPPEAIAIARKTGRPVSHLAAWPQLPYWREAYRCFITGLGSQVFAGIVFDYDGTLVDPCNRFDGPSNSIIVEVLRLLSTGIPVGIATGRGKSVGQALRDSLPSQCWPRVCVGYYNGSDIASLVETSAPDGRGEVCEALDTILRALQTESHLLEVAAITPRRAQITVAPYLDGQSHDVWRAVQAVLSRARTPDTFAVRSGHSVDILAPGVTKRALVAWLRSSGQSPANGNILCIGDRGAWPGNDAALLAEPWALSVDEVSADPVTCWNLSRAGVRGARATIRYCQAMQARPAGTFVLDTTALVDGR